MASQLIRLFVRNNIIFNWHTFFILIVLGHKETHTIHKMSQEIIHFQFGTRTHNFWPPRPSYSYQNCFSSYIIVACGSILVLEFSHMLDSLYIGFESPSAMINQRGGFGLVYVAFLGPISISGQIFLTAVVSTDIIRL